jgi:hypothetical protein
MGGHAERQRGERLERCKIRLFQGLAVGSNDRQALVAVGGGAAVAGQVLDDGKDAAAGEALGDRRGDR